MQLVPFNVKINKKEKNFYINMSNNPRMEYFEMFTTWSIVAFIELSALCSIENFQI